MQMCLKGFIAICSILRCSTGDALLKAAHTGAGAAAGAGALAAWAGAGGSGFVLMPVSKAVRGLLHSPVSVTSAGSCA
jgi:hypothetical protein